MLSIPGAAQRRSQTVKRRWDWWYIPGGYEGLLQSTGCAGKSFSSGMRTVTHKLQCAGTAVTGAGPAGGEFLLFDLA